MSKIKFPIGLDIGHSAVKIVGNNGLKIIFPSIAVPAVRISEEREAARAALETVSVKGRDYFFGKTAEIQYGTSVASGLNEDWINTNEHTALIMGAMKKIEQAGINPQSDLFLVLGLPTRVHSAQKERLRQIVAEVVPNATIKVLPQPWGPFQKIMADINGLPSQKHSILEEEWGVIEIGYYTTDILLIRQSRYIEKASESCAGVRVAAEHLSRLLSDKGYKADLIECEKALRNKFIMQFGEKIDVTEEVAKSIEIVVSEVVDTADRLLAPYVHKINGVVIAGGGAPLVFDTLKKRWPHAVMDEDSRFSVAEGFRRYALVSQYIQQ